MTPELTKLLAAAQCPTPEPPPPPSVCGASAYTGHLAPPGGIGPSDSIYWRIECGQSLDTSGPVPVLRPCARFEARTEDSQRVQSDPATISDMPQCLPVPEPGFTTALLIAGCLLWYVAPRLRHDAPLVTSREVT